MKREIVQMQIYGFHRKVAFSIHGMNRSSKCSYQFVYCINKCFSHSVIELAKYLFESLIIKQCGKIYLYLIFYCWRHNQGGTHVN